MADGARPHPRPVAVPRRLVRDLPTPAARGLLRSTRGEGTVRAGTVLDDRLTIACGEGAVRIVELQRAGGAADERGGISARHAGRAGMRLS